MMSQIQNFEKKKDTDNCERERSLFHSAMSIAKMGVWTLNLSSLRLDLSKEVYDITGASPNEFDNTLEFVQNHIIHPDSHQAFSDAVQLALEKNQVFKYEFKILKLDGSIGWIRLNGDTVKEEGSDITYLVGTILDITHEVIAMNAIKDNYYFLKTLVDSIPNPVFYKDEQGIYQYCNDAFLDYVGHSREQVIGHSVFDVAPKWLADVYHKADLDLMESKGKQEYEANVKLADGTLHDVVFNKASVTDPAGQLAGLVGIMQDVTQKNDIERQLVMLHRVKDIFIGLNHRIVELQDLETFFRVMLVDLLTVFRNSNKICIFKTDDPNQIESLYCIGYMTEEIDTLLLQIRNESICIKENDNPIGIYAKDLDSKYVMQDLLRITEPKSNQSSFSSILIPVIFDEKIRWIISTDSSIEGGFSDSDLLAAKYIQEEIPILIRVMDLYIENLSHARFDHLTGVLSRGYFNAILDDQLKVAMRSNEPLHIASFDLNGLKEINDQLGHQAGDNYLKAFINKLSQNIRKTDTIGRVGGDEFSVIFLDSPLEDIERRLSQFKEEFEKYEIFGETGTFRGGFGFGVASFRIDSTDKDTLLKLADQRMYLNKNEPK